VTASAGLLVIKPPKPEHARTRRIVKNTFCRYFHTNGILDRLASIEVTHISGEPLASNQNTEPMSLGESVGERPEVNLAVMKISEPGRRPVAAR
jgi:hypothetical protein